jgi:hypothetical protein
LGQITSFKFLQLQYSGSQICLQCKGEIKMAVLICGSFRRSQPAGVRNVLTPSAFCLEDEGLYNRNSVFLINPDNRQLIDALQYESDISDVIIFLIGKSLFVA